MTRTRLEAFSDAVIAIIMTIMVLELKAPHAASWSALLPLAPVFLSYLLSFCFLGIYWNNHHHMLHTVSHVNGSILWANLHLLFWLSLIPFATAWMGEKSLVTAPTAFYGFVLLLSAVAYTILQQTIIVQQGRSSTLRQAIGRDGKGKLSVALYLLALGLSFVAPPVAVGIYVLVALLWLIPDRRIEKALSHNS